MQIYLGVTATDYPEAAATGHRFAYVAYRIGRESALLRQNLPIQTRNGLLSISDRDAPPVRDPETLCGAVLRECTRRGYTGVVLDFEGQPRRDLNTFAGLLDSRLRDTGRTLFLPQQYARAAPEAICLLCTAISGGNFRTYLREEVQRRAGGEHLALDIQRLRMDFRLPAPSGEGEPLNAETFAALVEGEAVFFSPDLCARYFTYTQDGEAHFVLFDDANTLNQKLRIGAEFGIETAFFMWPEIRDIAADIQLK